MPSYLSPAPYERLLSQVFHDGQERSDRTGVGTRSIFGAQMRFDLSEGFPLITTKKVHFKSVIEELLWFIRGETNVKPLQAEGVRIWNEWADENGDLGPVYGAQYRRWKSHKGSHDQLQACIDLINSDPSSRRNIVSAWNVGELDDMALHPCHILFQVYVQGDELSLHVYQRSADMFLGVPFNIASYATLAHILAARTGLVVKDLIWSGGDCHIYQNHLAAVELQLSRVPRALPRLEIARTPPRIEDYVASDFIITGYDPHPAIKGEVAV